MKVRMNRNFWAYVLLFVSGGCGLGYQIVWTRMFAVGLGHEYRSLLAVITAFFGGLSLGAWVLDKYVRRSERPGYYFLVLEVLIGVWGLATIFLIPWLNDKTPLWLGLDAGFLRLWLVPFGVTFFGLLPATVAMGATLAAMEAVLRGENKKVVGGVYGANTLGAVAGVMGVTVLLIPNFGYLVTVLVLCVSNLLCGAGVLFLGKGEAAESTGAKSWEGRKKAKVKSKRNKSVRNKKIIREVPFTRERILVSLFVTGLVGIGYETLGVRVMGQVLENTVYSYASALSVYLLFTAMGAWFYQVRLKEKGAWAVFNRGCVGLALTVLWGMFVLQYSEGVYRTFTGGFGAGIFGSILGELVLALGVFGPATFVMGIVFSHLTQQLRNSGGGVGKALGINTLGATLACFVFGLVFLPWIGARWAFVLVVLGYLAIRTDFVRPGRVVVSAVILAGAAGFPFNLRLVSPMAGGEVKIYREGVSASVAVVTDGAGNRYLKVNDSFRMGNTKSTFGERRLGHIPLLLHRDPRKVLYLGMGTASTACAGLEREGVEVTAVELVPEIVELLGEFHEINHRFDQHENVSIYIADARRFVRASQEKYDVIVGDLFHPARDGSGLLYTVEHFRAISERLAKGGVFCQWLPFYQMDEETAKLITRTFLEVFPEGKLWLANFNGDSPALGLISAPERIYDENWMDGHLSSESVKDYLERCDLSSNEKLFGGLLAGNVVLRQWAGDGKVNTDMHPRVIFQAPRFIYLEEEALTPERFVKLLKELGRLKAASEDVGIKFSSESLGKRVSDYVKARDVFLSGWADHYRGNIDEAIEKYVESVRISGEFGVGYQAAMQIAMGLDRQQRKVDAYRIFKALMEADPEAEDSKRIKMMLGGI